MSELGNLPGAYNLDDENASGLEEVKVEYQTPFKNDITDPSQNKFRTCETPLMFLLTSLMEALQLGNIKQAAAFLT